MLRSIASFAVFVLLSGVAAAQANPNAREAIDKCKRGLADLPDVEPAAKAARMAMACADLYSEPRCRAAWIDFEVPPSKRIPFVISECREAYCPKLAGAKAAICADPFDPGAATTRQQWAELQGLIFARDLGPAGARELIAAIAGAATKTAPAATTTAATATARAATVPTREELGLTVEMSESELRLYSRSGGEGTATHPKLVLRKRAADGSFDYAALRRALAEIVRRRWPGERPAATKGLALSAEAAVTYEQVLRVMDVARESFPDVTFALRPAR